MTNDILNVESTSVNDKDPDLTGFEIHGINILVRPVHVEAKTKGGILLTDKLQDDASYLTNVGKVLAIGSLAYTQEEFGGESWCKVGDYVLLPKLAGNKIKYKGVPLIIVGCNKVMATLDDPKTVDMNFNLTGY